MIFQDISRHSTGYNTRTRYVTPRTTSTKTEQMKGVTQYPRSIRSLHARRSKNSFAAYVQTASLARVRIVVYIRLSIDESILKGEMSTDQ